MTDVLAAMPLLAPAAGALLVLSAITLGGGSRFPFALTVASLAFAVASAPLAAGFAPRTLGPLLLLDRHAVFFAALLALAALAVAMLVAARHKGGSELYLLILVATTGAATLAATDHLATLFVALETLSVALFGAIAFGRDRRGCAAGVQYLVLAGSASAVLLFGLGLLYVATGSLLWRDVLAISGAASAERMAVAGAALLIAGLAFKLALVPFHMWAPDVYAGAPLPVAALLATVSKVGVAAVLLRFTLSAAAVLPAPLVAAVAALAAASMLGGNLLALLERNPKRLLAYSSTAQMGYVVVALLAGGTTGANAATFYLVAYSVAALLAFGALLALSPTGGDIEDASELRGLVWRRPLGALLFSTGLLSLAGLPLTAGFFGKLLLVSATVTAAQWLLLAAMLTASAVGSYVYLRLFIIMLQPAPTPAIAPAPPGAPVLLTVTLGVAASVVVALGAYPEGLALLIAASIGRTS